MITRRGLAKYRDLSHGQRAHQLFHEAEGLGK